MGEDDTNPPPRRDFPAFPFEPYPIQTEFMSFLYSFLDKGGGVAMLESPTGTSLHSISFIHLNRSLCLRTNLFFNSSWFLCLLVWDLESGTGKTLSLICSAIQWVVDHREKQQLLKSMKLDTKLGEANDDGNCDEPQWMRDFEITAVEKKEVPRKRSEFGLGDFHKKRSGAKSANVEKMGVQSLDDEGDFLLEEYVSEDESTEGGIEKSKRKRATDSNWSSSSDEEAYEEEDEEVTPKVYFCSRTHSQLSQFVDEFRRTGFALALKVTCLGSRKNLCINSGKLASDSLTNLVAILYLFIGFFF